MLQDLAQCLCSFALKHCFYVIFDGISSIHLSINDEKAASIDTGEKVTIRLPAGEYSFSVVPTDPFGTHAVFSIDQRLEDGKVYTYRILTDGDDLKTRIQRTITTK